MQVRISAATPEADLAAAIWPGVTSVSYPRCESGRQIEQAEALITRLERLRGLRPGRVEIQPIIETTRGVTRAPEIIGWSARAKTVAIGPSMTLEVAQDALDYARFECELHARALGVTLLDPFSPHD
jgi:citrate lyase beta subunit